MTKYIEIDGIGEVVPRSEYDAVAAQVHVLNTAASFILNAKLPLAKRKAYAALSDAVNKTPQHHLRQVRADAVKKFVGWAADTQPNIDCMLDDSTDYIASILAGKE